MTLISDLVHRGVIQDGTVLEAWFKASDMAGQRTVRTFGEFRVYGINTKNNQITFTGRRYDDPKEYKISESDIITIDGMRSEQLADCFGISYKKERSKDKYIRDKWGKIVGEIQSDGSTVWDNDSADDGF